MASSNRFSFGSIMALAILALSVLNQACVRNEAESKPGPQTPAKAGAALFAEPNLTAEAFIEAAAAVDEWMMSQCFSEHCLPEFSDLRLRKTSEERLKELSAIFVNARVGEVTKQGDTALVEVVLVDGTETLEMIQTSDGWRITGF